MQVNRIDQRAINIENHCFDHFDPALPVRASAAPSLKGSLQEQDFLSANNNAALAKPFLKIAPVVRPPIRVEIICHHLKDHDTVPRHTLFLLPKPLSW